MDNQLSLVGLTALTHSLKVFLFPPTLGTVLLFFAIGDGIPFMSAVLTWFSTGG